MSGPFQAPTHAQGRVKNDFYMLATPNPETNNQPGLLMGTRPQPPADAGKQPEEPSGQPARAAPSQREFQPSL